jgi:predicted aconitase with swiveling domain
LRLEKPLSFWGGVDADTGRVIATRHPQQHQLLAGQIIALERSIGSSSGSSVLLELLDQGCGPLGIILRHADEILALAALVAREIGIASIPVIQVSDSDFRQLPPVLHISVTGEISAAQ